MSALAAMSARRPLGSLRSESSEVKLAFFGTVNDDPLAEYRQTEALVDLPRVARWEILGWGSPENKLQGLGPNFGSRAAEDDGLSEVE
jgi:hypothetical protein